MRKSLAIYSIILILLCGAAEKSYAFNARLSNPDSTIAKLIQHINPDSIKSYMLKLEGYNDRGFSLPNRDTLAEWLSNKFKSFGFTQVTFDSSLYSGIWIKNVIAFIPGKSADSPLIIAGAHYDSNFNPGADDNASGTSAVLEMARALKKSGLASDYSFSFQLYAAEERGMIGSRYLANKYRAENRNIALMINLDMIANSSDTNRIVKIIGHGGFEQYAEKSRLITEKFTGLIGNRSFNNLASDSRFFYLNGYPAIFFHEYEFSQKYHSKNDSVAYCNTGYASKVTRAALAVMYNFTLLPERPSYVVAANPGDGSRARLKWLKSSSAGVVSYKVGIGKSEYIYDSTFVTNDTSAVIDNLLEGTSYHFGVSALDADNNESMINNVSLTISKYPAPPQNFSDAPAKDRIVLSWNRNTEEDLAGYNIYRKAGQNSSFGKLNNTLLTDTLYEDKSIQDNEFIYTVTGVDKDGKESEKTQAVVSHAVTMSHGIVILDGSDEQNSKVFPDSQTDSTYAALVPGGMVTSIDLKTEMAIKLSELGKYSAIIWHNEVLNPLIINTDVLRKYLDLGGCFMYTGFNVQYLAQVNGVKDYHYFSGDDFVYKYLKIKTVYSNSNSLFAVGAYPAVPEYEHIYTDSKKLPSWSLKGIQVLEPAEKGKVVFTYQPEGAQNIKDRPAGVEYTGTDYKTFVLSFPLFYLDPQIASRLIYTVLKNKFNILTDVKEDNAALPSEFSLNQNYPNPFNPSTTINYSLPVPSDVTLKVFDLLGREVTMLVNAHQSAGNYKVKFDASLLPSGVYIYSLHAGGFIQSRKLLLLK